MIEHYDDHYGYTRRHKKTISDAVTSSEVAPSANGNQIQENSRSWAADALEALRYALSARLEHPLRIDPESSECFITRYANRLKEGTAISWLKYHTSYMFAYGTGQSELPRPPVYYPLDPPETPGCPLGGDAGRLMRRLMARAHSGNWAARRACFDVLMSKLGMPVVPESFVAKTLEEHRKGLTISRDDSLPDERAAIGRTKEKIEEIVRSIFRGSAQLSPGDESGTTFHHRDLIPSLRACQEAGLASGGALGFLFDNFAKQECGSWGRRSEILVSEFLGPSELYSMSYVAGKVVESRIRYHDDLVERFQDFVDSLWKDRSGPIDATPAAILEPLKVRIITKGGAAEYYRALELQKFVHGVMRRHPVFKYIGEPASDEDFLGAFGTSSDLGEDEFYVSGDYKAATDNLNPELSAYAWERIAYHSWVFYEGERTRLLYTPYYSLGRRALVEHQLHYDSGSFQQVWGQLMGSPMSFPILCLVNAAATCVALDWRFSEDLPLRVNGDDIGFISNPAQYESWKFVTACCGLQFSEGKNYTSREFLIVNSELRRPPARGDIVHKEVLLSGFMERPEDDGPSRMVQASLGIVPVQVKKVACQAPWRLEGFVNQSLLRGTIKKGIDAGKPMDLYWPDLSSLQTECLRGFPMGEKRDKINRLFLKRYHQVIKEMPCLFCDKFIPKSLGGGGLEKPRTWSAKNWQPEIPPVDTSGSVPTELVLDGPSVAPYRLAALMACDHELRLSRPALGKSYIGVLGEVFREARKQCDVSAPPVLRDRPRVREHGTRMVGGGPFLGECLTQFLRVRDFDFEKRVPLGGEAPSSMNQSPKHHSANVVRINKAYLAWATRKYTTKLKPIGVNKALVFKEHKELYSLCQLVPGRASVRLLDGGSSPFAD